MGPHPAHAIKVVSLAQLPEKQKKMHVFVQDFFFPEDIWRGVVSEGACDLTGGAETEVVGKPGSLTKRFPIVCSA